MKKFLALCAAGAISVAALSPAAAIAGSTTEGKTVSYSAGKLKVSTKKSTATYIVDKKTDCGFSKGQMGDGMPCSNLKQKKFLGKAVTVKWSLDGKKRRVATLVSVHL